MGGEEEPFWPHPILIRVKMTKADLEFITYPNMFTVFEKGTRGEIFYICNRYSQTNQNYLK